MPKRVSYPHEQIENVGSSLRGHAETLRTTASDAGELPGNSLGSIGEATASTISEHLANVPGQIRQMANREEAHGNLLTQNSQDMRAAEQQNEQRFRAIDPSVPVPTVAGSGATESADETGRGTGSVPVPPNLDDIKDALRQRSPQLADTSKYTSEDGHYYATRVFEGGRPDGETVFAGHGVYRPGDGTTTVPDRTWVAMYVDHGDALNGLAGLAVEAGVYPGVPVRIFGPGEELPDYTLRAPASMTGGMSVFSDSTTVANPTRLSSLLKENMGTVHWAACREVRP